MRHIIKLSMILLAVVSTYFVFDVMAVVAPMWVATASSVSLASVYVGLAFADVPRHQSGTALAIAGTALFIEAAMGIMHALRVLVPSAFSVPPAWAIVIMTILYGVSFSVLLFSVAHFVMNQERDEDNSQIAQTLRHVAALAQASTDNAAAIAAIAEASKSGMQATAKASTAYECPGCGAILTQGQYGAAVRHGYCSKCKPTIETDG